MMTTMLIYVLLLVCAAEIKAFPASHRVLFHCDFEAKCAWSHAPGPTWHAGRRTFVAGTGPNHDHTSGTGTFAYIQASSAAPGAMATMTTPPLHVPTSCHVVLTFFYSMYGRDTGTLDVNINNGRTVWSRSGQQEPDGNTWGEGEVTLEDVGAGELKLDFVATSKSGKYGDIAIDDVTVTEVCRGRALEAVQQIPLFVEKVTYACDFEKPCDFRQPQNDNFDWTKHSGRTNTAFTGPVVDHTTGTALGHYMYIETSNQHNQNRAILESPPLTLEHGCRGVVKFYYSMYGKTVESLRVQLQTKHTNLEMWSRQGQQHTDANTWTLAAVSLPGVTAGEVFKILFIATKGQGYTGDIAIDDFSLVERCPPYTATMRLTTRSTTVPQQASIQHLSTQQTSTQHRSTQQTTTKQTTPKQKSTQQKSTQHKSTQHTTTKQQTTSQQTSIQQTTTNQTTPQPTTPKQTTTQQMSIQQTTPQQTTLQQNSTQQTSTQQKSTQQKSTQHTMTKQQTTPQQMSIQQTTPQQTTPQQKSTQQTSTQQTPTQQKSTQQKSTQQKSTQQKPTQQTTTKQQTAPQQTTPPRTLPQQTSIQQTTRQQTSVQQTPRHKSQPNTPKQHTPHQSSTHISEQASGLSTTRKPKQITHKRTTRYTTLQKTLLPTESNISSTNSSESETINPGPSSVHIAHRGSDVTLHAALGALGVVVAAVVLAIVVMDLRRRRRRERNEEETETARGNAEAQNEAFEGDNLRFQNNMYADVNLNDKDSGLGDFEMDEVNQGARRNSSSMA